MTERPIRCNAPEVRAILAGTKTQTRRAVKPHFGDPAFVIFAQEAEQDGEVTFWPYRSDDGETASIDDCEIPLRCPYGQPGDRLWVRETWALVDAAHKPADFERATRIVYRADGLTVPNQRDPEIRAMFAGRNALPDAGMKWRSSTSMPRVASRITLEITGVRVERLQDISEYDAMQEGVAGWALDPRCETARDGFRVLWDSINGPGSWDANPWVWVIEFRREPPA